jgi:hypothetical protein
MNNGMETSKLKESLGHCVLSFPPSSLDFTRGSFGKNGSVHIESCCNRCCFRIAATTPDDFDEQERAHSVSCGGSGKE